VAAGVGANGCAGGGTGPDGEKRSHWALTPRRSGRLPCDPLTVTLFARRRGKWREIAMAPGSYHTRVNLKSLGKGNRLRLRLAVSDGFNTRTIETWPIPVKRH
jgi:hypothetical protein